MHNLALQHVEPEIAARILGYITSLFSAFLLLPASRTGLLVDVLAVPYERTIKYHRILGYLTFLFMTLHALIWWCKWLEEGHLGENIFEYKKLYEYRIAYQDWSISVIETAWALMGASILMAIFVRRRVYEFFQYSHKYIGIIYYVSAINHAWSMWYDVS